LGWIEYEEWSFSAVLEMAMLYIWEPGSVLVWWLLWWISLNSLAMTTAGDIVVFCCRWLTWWVVGVKF